MGKGSKAPSGPQEVVQTTSNLPEYARPYFTEMLGRTMYETTRPYETFPGQRLADFSDFEQAGMAGMYDMARRGDPTEVGIGSQVAADIAQNYSPDAVSSGYTAGTITPGYQAGDITNRFAAGQRNVGYDPTQFNVGYTPGTMQMGYGPTDYQSGYTASQYAGPTFEAGTSTDPTQIQDYMNPYTQLVTDIQKREARKQSDISGANIAQQAAQAGGLGGYREAIMQAEREGDLAQQLQDIQATGDQAAYQQAMQAMEADRAARLQEAQMGLSVQQQQEAARQAQEAARLAGATFQESSQARLQDFKTQQFQMEEQARQEAARMGLSAQEAEDRAKQAGEDFRQKQFAQNEELRMAQQQEDRAVFDAQERARLEGARLGLNAQEIQERVNQAENEARMRAAEFNVGARERGTGMRMDAARFLGDLGAQRQQMEFDRYRNLQAAGQMQRELAQRGLDIGYQDFLRQQAFPREQLSFFSNILRGLPITPGSTQATYGERTSPYQQALGAGIGGVGLYNALRGGR